MSKRVHYYRTIHRACQRFVIVVAARESKIHRTSHRISRRLCTLPNRTLLRTHKVSVSFQNLTRRFSSSQYGERIQLSTVQTSTLLPYNTSCLSQRFVIETALTLRAKRLTTVGQKIIRKMVHLALNRLDE